MYRGGVAHRVRDRDFDLVAPMEPQRWAEIAPVEAARGRVASCEKGRATLLGFQNNAIGLSPRIDKLRDAKRVRLGGFEPLKTEASRRSRVDGGATGEKSTSRCVGHRRLAPGSLKAPNCRGRVVLTALPVYRLKP